MDRCTHVHVCGGSEPEYTNGRQDFIFGSRLEKGGTASFQFSSRGGGEETENFQSSSWGKRCFNIRFQFQETPLVVINDISLTSLKSPSAWSVTFNKILDFFCMILQKNFDIRTVLLRKLPSCKDYNYRRFPQHKIQFAAL